MSKTVGSRMREARESRGLTITEVAEAVGKTRSTILSWEVDETSPRLVDVDAICKALDVRPAWLVFGRAA